eukprot:624296-Amphidinium_carterae.1
MLRLYTFSFGLRRNRCGTRQPQQCYTDCDCGLICLERIVLAFAVEKYKVANALTIGTSSLRSSARCRIIYGFMYSALRKCYNNSSF